MELHHIQSRSRSNELDRMVGNAKRATNFLKALAHESRLMILCILAEGEKSVSELEGLLNLRQPTVSQQLPSGWPGVYPARRQDSLLQFGERGGTHRYRCNLRRVLPKGAQTLARAYGDGRSSLVFPVAQ